MLTPCEGCKRHVRDEATCPFCGHVREPAAPIRRAVQGRLTRAAVFASAVLAAPACWMGPAPADPHAAPPAASTGTVRGVVRGSRNHPLSDVAVALEGGGRRFEAVTDRDGAFAIPNVPAGEYVLSAPGSEPRNIRVIAGQQHTVELRERYEEHFLPKPYGAPPARKRYV